MLRYLYSGVYLIILFSACQNETDKDLFISEIFINKKQEAYIIVKNQGTSFISEQGIRLSVHWDESKPIIIDLDTVDTHFRNPRDSSILRLPIDYTSGAHRVYAKIDIDYQLQETNETQNEYARLIVLEDLKDSLPTRLYYADSMRPYSGLVYQKLFKSKPFAHQIIWFENGKDYPLAQWKKSWTDKLLEKIKAIYQKKEIVIADTIQNTFKVDQAFDIYINYIAHSLVLEQEKRLPWSLKNYSDMELYTIWNAHAYFEWDSLYQDYHLDYQRSGALTLDHPITMYSFIKKIIPSIHNSTEAITSILEWCRANLVHSDKNNNTLYQLLYQIIYPEKGSNHQINSCWATAALLVEFGRAMNIPIRRKNIELYNGVHSMLEFTSENLYISHADDIYDPLFIPVPIYFSTNIIGMSATEINRLLTKSKICLPDTCHTAGSQHSFDRRRFLITRALSHSASYLHIQANRGRAYFKEYLNGDNFNTFLKPLFSQEEQKDISEKIKQTEINTDWTIQLLERYESNKNSLR